jgi:hypothetical protein
MKSWDVMKEIACRPSSPFRQRRNYLVIPNVSWGFLNYEADMLVISKSKYATEIEVKVSMADWKKDFEKYKHNDVDERIKYQYYAAPYELAIRYTELELPNGWGVISVGDPNAKWGTEGRGVNILKEAEARDAKKITDNELLLLARLACFRVWRRE